MARLYKSTRADLSRKGRRLVDESQRSWLADMHTVCPADERCLGSAYGRSNWQT